MAHTEAIRDFNGKILYWLDHKDNGDIVKRSFSGKIEETYDARSKTTRDFSGRINNQGNAIGGTSTHTPSQAYPQGSSTETIRDFSGKILYNIEHKANGDLVKKDFSGRIEGTYDARSNVTRDFSGKILNQGNTLGGTSQKSQAKPDSNNTYQPTHYDYKISGTGEPSILTPQNMIETIFAQMATPFYIMYKMFYAILRPVINAIKTGLENIDKKIVEDSKTEEHITHHNRDNAQDKLSQDISKWTKAIEINPKDAFAYASRGYAYHSQRNFAQAISDYTKTIEINPNVAGIYGNRGKAYLDQDNYTQAIIDYDKAIKLDPKLVLAYYDRGVAYYYLKDYDKAWTDVHKAKELGYAVDPKFIDTIKKGGAA